MTSLPQGCFGSYPRLSSAVTPPHPDADTRPSLLPLTDTISSTTCWRPGQWPSSTRWRGQWLETRLGQGQETRQRRSPSIGGNCPYRRQSLASRLSRGGNFARGAVPKIPHGNPMGIAATGFRSLRAPHQNCPLVSGRGLVDAARRTSSSSSDGDERSVDYDTLSRRFRRIPGRPDHPLGSEGKRDRADHEPCLALNGRR
jgi:hypothetical protein